MRDGDILTVGSSKLRFGVQGKGGAPVKKSSRVRILLLLLLLMLMLAGACFIAMGSKDKAPQKAEQSVLEQERAKESAAEDAGVKRAIAVHLSNGKRYMEEGKYPQALERF